MNIYRQLYLLSKTVKDSHQSIDGETFQPCATDTGKIGWSNARQRSGLTYGQLFFVQDRYDLRSQNCPELLQIGIWLPEVTEHVATAANQIKVIVHSRSLSSVSISHG